MNAITETNFNFKGQTAFYRGKVRDVYFVKDLLIMVASDRISAFDIVLPRGIPHKGKVLNLIAAQNLEAVKDIVPCWLTGVPDPNVSVGVQCETYPVEMVVRGYLAGHAWREYREGKREVCGVALPDGLKENDRLPEPVITPTTKANEGHDEDISREEIIEKGLVSEEDYIKLEQFSLLLFKRGTELAADSGLILVDTKYEFGKKGDTIYLIDEIHTPDSSRYFYADTYHENQAAGLPQKQLSKEFVREWLIENGFQGKEGQKVPEMTDEKVSEISDRYIELYEKFTGEKFDRGGTEDINKRIENNIKTYLNTLI